MSLWELLYHQISHNGGLIVIYYHLPGLFEYFDLYKVFIDIFQHESYKFRDVQIGSIYGAPKGCLWNGGRIGYDDGVDVFEVASWAQSHNINCALTFTNCLLEENHFQDKNCNALMRLFHREGNSITIFSDELKDYIHSICPKYQFTSSTTKCLRNLDSIIEEARYYDIVVLDYNFNHQEEFLKNLENKDKYELLVNSVCNPECPRRFEHYVEVSEFSLGIRDEHLIFCPCQRKKFWEILDNPTVLKIEDIYRYHEMGFSHFKIEGRTTHFADLIEILVYYMVKPEYQIEIRQRLTYS